MVVVTWMSCDEAQSDAMHGNTRIILSSKYAPTIRKLQLYRCAVEILWDAEKRRALADMLASG